MMTRTTAVLVLVLLSGCATEPASRANDALSDFVVVSELVPLDVVRFRDRFNVRPLTERYALLQSRGDRYLIRFRRRCHELYENRFPPDIRHDRNALRAGIDTIRGCRIDRLYAVDEPQAEELKLLAERLEDE